MSPATRMSLYGRTSTTRLSVSLSGAVSPGGDGGERRVVVAGLGERRAVIHVHLRVADQAWQRATRALWREQRAGSAVVDGGRFERARGIEVDVEGGAAQGLATVRAQRHLPVDGQVFDAGAARCQHHREVHRVVDAQLHPGDVVRRVAIVIDAGDGADVGSRGARAVHPQVHHSRLSRGERAQPALVGHRAALHAGAVDRSAPRARSRAA